MHMNFYLGDSAPCEIAKRVTKFMFLSLVLLLHFIVASSSGWDYYCIFLIIYCDFYFIWFSMEKVWMQICVLSSVPLSFKF